MSRSDASETLNSSWLHGPSFLTLAVAIVVILVSCTNSSVPLAEDMDPSLGPPNHEEVATEAPASATHTTGVQSISGPTAASNIPLPTPQPRPTMQELRSRWESTPTDEPTSILTVENLLTVAYSGVISFVGLSMVFGLLWSPFAALICRLIVHLRGLPGSGYGGAGFRYSLLFLLPWIYLVLRMVGVPFPMVVVRVGYGLLYGLWLVAAVGSFAGGLFVASLYFLGNDDARGSGCHPAHHRRLVHRRSVVRVTEKAAAQAPGRLWRCKQHPMRAAYVALYALWALIALGIFFEGMFEFSEFGKIDSAVPLWTCAALMALAWVLALKAFDISTADRWDRPSNPVPDLLPPTSAYLEPFVHLYLLIVIPGAVGIAVYLFGVILWLG